MSTKRLPPPQKIEQQRHGGVRLGECPGLFENFLIVLRKSTLIVCILL